MRALRLIVCLFVSATAFGQGASTIVGRVTSNGKPLGSAIVTIDADVLQNTRATRTTTRGTYWAALLPAGTYRITFAHNGTQTVTRKAEVRIGETVRVDADLQPSEEGESVTMTTITRSILERTQLATSLDPAIVDDLPMARDLTTRLMLAPGTLGGAIRGSTGNVYIVDGVVQRRRGANVEIEEAIGDAAVIETTTSADYGHFSGGVIIATTRSGSNETTASIRETLTEGIDSRTEATVGGRLVRDALWYFLAGETAPDERSGMFKLTASPGSRATLSGMVLRAPDPDESRASADATVMVSHRALISGHVDTSRVDGVRDDHQSLSIHSLIPTRFGDHAFSAGAERYNDTTSVFAGDSWSDGARWVLSASGRYDENLGTSRRAGVAYDLAGDGRARIAATYARYAGDSDIGREETLTYSQRVLTSGFSRIALVRRNYDSGLTYHALEGEFRADYLFLGGGGSASLAHHQSSGVVWITGTPPALEQHFTLALLERYRGGLATDMALQYRFTRFKVEPFSKIDFMNLFDNRLTYNDDPVGARRALRLSFGARL
ncbi:MAG TPA: carboxypeptidase-like regulatory domain-containing protein [Thermoanaerobaculia bacterium]|nr:carboxypeptidase-like regulatory domain-containing protein [Thermoanaerobaculia bacterium]